MLKRRAARWFLRRLLPRFDAGTDLDRLLGKAVRLQLALRTDEDFRRDLDAFYRETDRRDLAEQLRFAELRLKLDRPDAYKIGITRLAAEAGADRFLSRFDMWRRRFGLLQHLDVRCDVLVLRQEQQVPPHGHSRVVSGFYLLEGRVACRHYDRIREEEDCVVVRQVLDLVHEPGGYTTNSESHHNIHWLKGIAPTSYLFRVTVTNTPMASGQSRTANSRIYVDPTGHADAQGWIRAPYLSEAEVARVSWAEGGVTSGAVSEVH